MHEICGYVYLGERYYFLKDEFGVVSLFPESSMYNIIVEVENEIIKPEEHERPS